MAIILIDFSAQIGNHGPEEGIELQSGWSSVRSGTEGSHEREGENKPEMDENGNPTTYTNGGSNGPFPIMDPQLRPLSIYRYFKCLPVYADLRGVNYFKTRPKIK